MTKMNNHIKERPILFSAPMVRAILDGRKSQTRRIAKVTSKGCKEGFITPLAGFVPRRIENHLSYCPYGKPGNRLWVRETFAKMDDESGFGAGYIEYKASCNHPESIIWTPSIHMPRWASRILLEITNVRVERLQDISEEDAIAEGIDRVGGKYSCSPWRNYRIGKPGEMSCHCSYPPRSYLTLWESINGPGSWDLNPLVWVLEFKVISKC